MYRPPNNYQELIDLLTFSNRCLNDFGKQFFVTEVIKTIDKYPNLKTFGWKGYTPYFNDGDACTYGVYTDFGILNGIDLEEETGEYSLEGLSSTEFVKNLAKPYKPKELLTDCGDLIDAPNNLLARFGEGVIEIDNEGKVSIEYVDHD